MKVFTKKGQSILEYAFVLVGVIMAIVAIQLYMKRGLEGRVAEATNDIGNQFRITSVEETSSEETRISTARSANVVQTTLGDVSTTVSSSTDTREGSLYVSPY